MPQKGSSRGMERHTVKVEHAEEWQREESEDRDGDEGQGDEEAGSAKYELFEKIVAFFEDRPYFYDIGDEDYRDKKRKESELADFARSINWTPEAVLKRWRNWRTDYGKIRRWDSHRYGQGARRRSVLQQWKLQALSFLDPYIHRRSSASGVGRGGQDETTEQTGDDMSSDEEAETEARSSIQRGRSTYINQNRRRSFSPDIPRSSTISYKRKRMEKTTEQDLGDILSKIQNRQDNETVYQMNREVKQQPTERDTFAAWMGSVVQQVPASCFRSFQKEAFALCLRYIDQVQPDQTEMRDPLQYSRSIVSPTSSVEPSATVHRQSQCT